MAFKTLADFHFGYIVKPLALRVVSMTRESKKNHEPNPIKGSEHLILICKQTTLNNMKYILIIIATTIVTGCSSSTAYHSMQQYQINQCQQLPSSSDYNDCIQQTKKTFNEYNKEREETIRTEPTQPFE